MASFVQRGKHTIRNFVKSYQYSGCRSSIAFYPFLIVGFGASFIGLNQNEVSAMRYVNAGNLNWKDTPFLFDTITPGFERHIEQNGKVLFYAGSKRIKASNSKGYTSGVHEFKIKMDHGSFNQSYFGVYSQENGTKYYAKSLGGIYRNKEKLIDTRRWKIGETIEMVLDCDQGIVSFGIESDGMDSIEIDHDTTYHVFVSAKAQPDKGWATGFTIL